MSLDLLFRCLWTYYNVQAVTDRKERVQGVGDLKGRQDPPDISE
jgi:hypothetical protein